MNLFVSKLLFFVRKRHFFETNTKIASFEGRFDTWMILTFRYCG